MKFRKPYPRKTAGSTRLRYFLSYFIIFCFLITGFFYIVRSQLAKLYLEQLTVSSEEQLHNVRQTLAEEFNAMNTVNNYIKDNVSIIFTKYTTDQGRQYLAYKELRKYIAGRPYIKSVIYLNKNHNVVTSSQTVTEYKEGAFHMLTPNPFVFNPVPYLDSRQNQLLYLQEDGEKQLIYFPVNSSYANDITYFLVDTREIEQLCLKASSSEMPAVALLDSGKNIIAGKNTEFLTPYMDSFEPKDGIYPIDNNTSLCVSGGLSNDFLMLSLISNQVLLGQVNSAFRTAYLILFALGLAGFLLLLMSMRITYLPLHKLTQKIVASPDKRQSYLEQLDQTFADSSLQNRRLQDKLEKYKLSIQKSILDNIITSNHATAGWRELPDIDRLFDAGSDVLLFAVKMKSPRAPFPCGKIVEFFCRSLTVEDSCVILETAGDTAILLINYSGAEPNKDEVLELLLTDLQREKGYLSSLSDCSDSPLDIPSLYEQAIQASGLWGEMPVVTYREAAPLLTGGSALAYPYEMLSALSASLQNYQFQEANGYIQELFRIIDQSESMDRQIPDFFAHCILIDLLAVIANAMEHSDIRFKSYSNLYFEALYLCRSCSYGENAAAIQANIQKLTDFFQEQWTAKSASSFHLKEQIEKNFTRPDFSINQLAEQFHVSIAYISYLVKKEINQNFSDYIWELRLNRARELLLSTDQSIDEISVAVGYLNTSSFRRKFKQDTGLTPSQYRSQAGERGSAPS
nr:AraC family transcriptional regulator [uncultured Acetatifactor sp.]